MQRQRSRYAVRVWYAQNGSKDVAADVIALTQASRSKECKRRKVKCDGKSPCHHCHRYDAQCSYLEKPKPGQSRHSLEMDSIKRKFEMLQEQVDLLVSRDSLPDQAAQIRLTASVCSPRPDIEFETSTLPQADAQFPVDQTPRVLGMNGLNSSTSMQGTARESLQARSIHSAVILPDDVSISHSTCTTKSTPSALGRFAGACHPLLSISQAEAMRLIDIYEDECGSGYPLVDIESIRNFAFRFYHGVTASRKPATWHPFQLDQPSKKPFHSLEMILAIALVVEGHGSTHLSSALVDELEAEIDHRPCGVSSDSHFAELLTLMSLYQFYRDEEVLAWRTIGLAARVALELGLHLREPPFATFRDDQERERANRLFWCIYALDRRWSFGTGLPFALHEDDIDPSLPEPNDSHPYLFTSMIAYSRVGSKILKASSGSDLFPQSGKREDAAYLTYQVQQWQSSLAPELRVDPDQEVVIEGLSPARNRLRVLSSLRTNHLRMLIHRRALLTPDTITADLRGARTAVDLAKNTVILLHKLHKTSDVYGSHRVCFNYFLYSALTLIFLAVYHAKAEFHEYCREEFHMALNLIGGHSAKSNVARKLWKIIKHLKVLGPEIGVLPYTETQIREKDDTRHDRTPQFEVDQSTNTLGQLFDDALPTAAYPPFSTQQISSPGTSIPDDASKFFMCDYAVDGSLLSSELSDLFQAIDPTRFEQMPAQLMNQQRSQHSTFETAQDFFRSL